MGLLWQQIIIGVVLAAAVAYLAWHFYRKAARKKQGCAACGLMKAAEKKRTGGERPISR